jgi:uncharacterized protein YijF (DUF1287 family)
MIALVLLLASPADRLVEAAHERTQHRVVYTPSYVRLAYPGGDVPPGTGVCTDVVIRAYRKLSIDLQALVHEDMRRAFAKYPTIWAMKRTDSNIDHRRVPNLRRFFKRSGAELPISRKAADYHPGDLVTWNLKTRGSLPHIGIVSDRKSPKGNPLIVHNIGAGPKLEDILFHYTITGHYRYFPKTKGNKP